MTTPTPSDLQPTHARFFIAVVLVVGCFAVGWAANRLAPGFSAHPLVDLFIETYQQIYYARVGQPGEPKVYYVYGSDFSELRRLVAVNPDLIELKETAVSKLATISIKSDATAAFELVKDTPGIESAFSIPFFCH